MRPSPVEALVFQCKAVGLPEPLREFRFHHKRRWRFDLAWTFQPDRQVYLVAVEIDGGAFLPGGSRHTRGAGYREDCEKLAEAACLGWRVIRILPEHVTNGKAIAWLEKLLK